MFKEALCIGMVGLLWYFPFTGTREDSLTLMSGQIKVLNSLFPKGRRKSCSWITPGKVLAGKVLNYLEQGIKRRDLDDQTTFELWPEIQAQDDHNVLYQEFYCRLSRMKTKIIKPLKKSWFGSREYWCRMDKRQMSYSSARRIDL